MTTLEQYTQEATKLCSVYESNKRRVKLYRKRILKESKEYFDKGISPYSFVKSIIDNSCPICGKALTDKNSAYREEHFRTASGVDYSTYKTTYNYSVSHHSSKICSSCDIKLSVKYFFLRVLVALLGIGIPIALVFGGSALARSIGIAWIAIPIVLLSIVGALAFFFIAFMGDSFTIWLGNLLKPLFGPFRVE